jgi:hypothetical protein
VPQTDGRDAKGRKKPCSSLLFHRQKVRRMWSVVKSGSLKTMVHCFWLHTVAAPLLSFFLSSYSIVILIAVTVNYLIYSKYFFYKNHIFCYITKEILNIAYTCVDLN